MYLHMSVSHSVHWGAVYLGRHPRANTFLARHPHWAETPRQKPPGRCPLKQIPSPWQMPPRQIPSPGADTPKMASEVSGTHPTGMHSYPQ